MSSSAIGYVIFELIRNLFAEGMHVYASSWDATLLSPPLIVSLIESLKFIIAFGIVLLTTRNFNATYLHCFTLQAFLYFINNCMYFQTLNFTSTATLSMLLHLRLPITAIIHHFIIKLQNSSIKWSAIVMVYSGILSMLRILN